MSADNGIVIGKFLVNGKAAFSVVETSAIDNVDYYRDRGDAQELREYVHDVWKRGKFFLDEGEALTYAHTVNNEDRTEYGVISMDFSDTDLKDFQIWMMHQIHQMWRDEKISGDQVALLLDEVCCY